MDFIYVHHSGRYDRSPETLVFAFNRMRNQQADVIGFTEISDDKRYRALKDACKAAGWGIFRVDVAGANECAIAYKLREFEFLEGTTVELTNAAYYSSRGKRKPSLTAVFVFLRHKQTRKTVIFSCAHTPSHVGTARGWRKGKRVITHQTGLRGWNRAMRKLTRLWHPTGGRVISADWNLDLKEWWVRQYLKVSFPRFYVVTDRVYLDTHGNRTIDGVLVGKRLVQRGKIVVIRMPDSDHRTVIVKLRSSKPKP